MARNKRLAAKAIQQGKKAENEARARAEFEAFKRRNPDFADQGTKQGQ